MTKNRKKPQEITAFLAPRRREIKDAILALAKETGCTCYPEFIRILNKNSISALDADKLCGYLIDLVKGSSRAVDGAVNAARAVARRHALQLDLFLEH